MTTTPTLPIDEHPIEQAKAYGQAHGESVSERVADYFAIPDAGAKGHGRERTRETHSAFGFR